MLFKEDFWLWILLLIPLALLIFKKWLNYHNPVFLLSRLPSFRSTRSWLSPDLLKALRIVSVILIIIALTDPKSIRSSYQSIPSKEIDIILAVDVSGSMMMEDLKPNRLEALKDVLGNFIARRPNDRIGIVLYAGESINWCPLTKNSFFLLNKLNGMEDKMLDDGTAIGLGLSSAVNALTKSKAKSKVIVLLTDGDNNAGFIDPLTASKIARKFNIKVYTIGVGTNGMAPLPLLDMDGNKTYHYVPVVLDEQVLKEIAGTTGGNYYRAQNEKALDTIYSEIDKVERTKPRIQKQISYQSEYRNFILVSLILIILEVTLRYTYFKTFV